MINAVIFIELKKKLSNEPLPVMIRVKPKTYYIMSFALLVIEKKLEPGFGFQSPFFSDSVSLFF